MLLHRYSQVPCCIACGRCPLMTLDTEMIAEEREDWKQLGVDFRDSFAIVGTEEVENMYFHQHPWVWEAFHRASQFLCLHHRYPDFERKTLLGHLPGILTNHQHLAVLVRPNCAPRLSGITQHTMTARFDGGPVPHNPQEARIGNGNMGSSQLFARYEAANASMLEPHLMRQTHQQLGYIVHAHCWVLLRDRVFGRELMGRMHLGIFVEAIQKFWRENSHLWNQSEYDPDGIEPRAHPLPASDDYSSPLPASEDYWDPPQDCTEDQNPAHAPEVQALIKQAVRIRHHSPVREEEDDEHQDDDNHSRLQRTWEIPTAPQVPLEIIMLIVDTIHNDPDYSQTGVEDTRNFLGAMRWKLPDSYWQSRCRKDLIFEILSSSAETGTWMVAIILLLIGSSSV